MGDVKGAQLRRRMGPPYAPHLNILGRSGTQFTSCASCKGEAAGDDTFLVRITRMHEANAHPVRPAHGELLKNATNDGPQTALLPTNAQVGKAGPQTWLEHPHCQSKSTNAGEDP